MAKARKSKSKAKKAKPKARRARGLVAESAGQPPYKCMTTLEPGVCLRFNLNPATGQYNQPAGGIQVNCTDCQYFFD
jgi:hypothetical protein